MDRFGPSALSCWKCSTHRDYLMVGIFKSCASFFDIGISVSLATLCLTEKANRVTFVSAV